MVVIEGGRIESERWGREGERGRVGEVIGSVGERKAGEIGQTGFANQLTDTVCLV